MTNHILKAETGAFAVIGGSAELRVKFYSETILEKAEEQFKSGNFGLAVILAQTACELAAQRIVIKSLTDNNVPQPIADAVLREIRSFNVGAPGVRKLLNALINKNLADDNAQVWEDFLKSTTFRNEAVHTGKEPSQPEARKSIDAVKTVVAYLLPLI